MIAGSDRAPGDECDVEDKPVVTGKDAGEPVGGHLIVVEALLQRESIMWTKGYLSTPAVRSTSHSCLRGASTVTTHSMPRAREGTLRLDTL